MKPKTFTAWVARDDGAGTDFFEDKPAFVTNKVGNVFPDGMPSEYSSALIDIFPTELFGLRKGRCKRIKVTVTVEDA